MLKKLSELFSSQNRNGRTSRTETTRRRLLLESLENRALMAGLTWSAGYSLPVPLAGASALESGGVVKVVGGGSTAAYQLPDGSRNWGVAVPTDINRTFPGFADTGSGSFLVYGGQVGNTAIDNALTYFPNNIDLVQDAATMSVPRTLFGQASDDSYRAFAIGGLNDQNVALSTVTVYNPATTRWANVASLPQSLFGESAVNDGNGHVFTFGGVTGGFNNGTVTTNVYRYTVSTNTWDTVAPMLVAERSGAAALGSNGRIYVLGGTAGGTTLSTVQSYDPVANTWALENDLPIPISEESVVTDSAGRLMVLGGRDQNHLPVATVYVSQDLSAPDALPVFTSLPLTSIATGTPFAYQVTTTANPQATYSLVTAPPGMSIDIHGLVTWTPALAQGGLNAVTVRATNIVGATDQTFSIRALTPAPTIPTGLTATGVTTTSIKLSWTASTDVVGVTGYRVFRIGHTGFHGSITTYTAIVDVVDTSTTITGLTSGYSYQYSVSALNASGNISVHSAFASARTQSPIVYLGPTQLNAVANHPLSFTLSVGANPATFTFTPLDAVPGMTVNATTGLVSWTPSDADVGPNFFNYRIDHLLGSITVQVGIQVGSNLPYGIYVPGPAAVATAPYTGTFKQTADAYNTFPVTFSLVSRPTGMTINANTGVIDWTPALADIGTSSSVVAQITNYAGSSNISALIPAYFASAPQNLAISHIRNTSATVSWSSPVVASEPIAGYRINATYAVRSGRFITHRTISYTAASTDTSLDMTGLPSAKSISVTITAFDATNRNGVNATTSLTTASVVPTVTVSGGAITYDGFPHTALATALYNTVQVPGTFVITYNGSTTPPTNAGVTTVLATFTSLDPNYTNAAATATLTVLKIAPVFTNLIAPSAVVGTATTILSGHLGAGAVYPTNDAIKITINGVSRTAIVNANGDFQIRFPVSTLAVGTYPITFAFAGDPLRFKVAVNGTSTLTITATPVAPVITLNPVSQTYTVGNIVTFTAVATGSPTPNLRWQISSNGGRSYTAIANATSPTLNFTATSAQNGYLVRAIFTNSAGSTISTAAILTLQAAK